MVRTQGTVTIPSQIAPFPDTYKESMSHETVDFTPARRPRS